MTLLRPQDEQVRGALTRLIAELGHAPSTALVARACNTEEREVFASYRRLSDTASLLLHPHVLEPWVVHPFALAAGGCWVETAERGYWANCLYCALGIAACLDRDAIITTRLGGERQTIEVKVRDRKLANHSDLLFHLSTPVAQWWDNVIFACASFQPFRNGAEIDDWCRRHALPRGHVMTLEALWPFARDWYGDYIRKPWRKRSTAENRALFARHSLLEPFWRA